MTLQQLQDQLAVVTAQSNLNDTSYSLQIAQYNQRKNSFIMQIASINTQITAMQNS